MKKEKHKMLLRLLTSIISTFIVIYIIIFVGGWRLFEPIDPILLELAAAIVLGFVIWLVFESTHCLKLKIDALEKRISEIENKQSTK